MDSRAGGALNSVAVVKHCYSQAGGMAQELVDYLNARVARVANISHPFPRADMPLNSTFQLYARGRCVSQLKTPPPWGPDPLYYVLDIFYTLYFFLRARLRVDLFVGLDNLNTLTGLLLRRLGLVRSVAFYVIDYVPQRFAGRRLNDLYHAVDKYCCYHADVIWNVSPNMMAARRAKWQTLAGVAPSRVVPLGCSYERIERLPISAIQRHDVVFLGSLQPEQGIQLLVEVWPAILARVPEARLVIMGGGSQEATLKQRIRDLGIEPRVRFLGFVVDDVEVERVLSRCAIGVAPYTEDTASFKYYCDPGKVKMYLAAGLPVVISRVPPVAQEIHQAEAGLAIRHDAGELTEALVTLLTQDDLYARFRTNAMQFAARYSWTRIFDEALAPMRDEPREESDSGCRS